MNIVILMISRGESKRVLLNNNETKHTENNITEVSQFTIESWSTRHEIKTINQTREWLGILLFICVAFIKTKVRGFDRLKTEAAWLSTKQTQRKHSIVLLQKHVCSNVFLPKYVFVSGDKNRHTYPALKCACSGLLPIQTGERLVILWFKA